MEEYKLRNMCNTKYEEEVAHPEIMLKSMRKTNERILSFSLDPLKQEFLLNII